MKLLTEIERIEKAEQYMAERGLAAWKLAAQAGIDPTTYSKIERGEREATTAAIREGRGASRQKAAKKPLHVVVVADGDVLARVFQKRHKQGELLTDRMGNPAYCQTCGCQIRKHEAYGSDRDGLKARRFWCGDCATGGPNHAA